MVADLGDISPGDLLHKVNVSVVSLAEPGLVLLATEFILIETRSHVAEMPVVTLPKR